MSDHQDSRLRSSGTRHRCVETARTNNPDRSEDVCQYLDRMVIERFTRDSHKIMFHKVGDEHPDSDVHKDTMSANTDTGSQLCCESCVTYHPVQSPSSNRSARRKRNTNRILAREESLGNPECERRLRTMRCRSA